VTARERFQAPSRSPTPDGFQGKVEIIELTNEQGTLLERFAIAQREARRRALRDYWIAYAFEGTVGPFRTDSDSSARDRVGGPTLGDVMYQGKWDKRRTRGDIVALFRMSAPGRLVRVAGRSYEQPAMPDELTIYCLDTVTEEESLTLLDSLIPQFNEGAIRDALLAINATHGSRRRGGIGAGLDADPDPDPDFGYDDNPAAERVALTPADYSLARDNARRYDKGADGAAVRRLAPHLDHVPLHGADLIRERATWALARMQGDALVAPLLEALNAADWHDRAAAAWSLAAIADARAAAPLRRALGDHAWRVRAHAVYGLGVLRDRAAVPVMIELLDDPHWQVRAAAAENLGLVGDSAAVPALKRALRDSHFAVTDAVETALAKLH
jgi:hypothetical protein